MYHNHLRESRARVEAMDDADKITILETYGEVIMDYDSLAGCGICSISGTGDARWHWVGYGSNYYGRTTPDAVTGVGETFKELYLMLWEMVNE